MNVKEMIGSRIKAIRTSKGFTQEGLAEKMDINSKYLSGIERGKENPTLNTFISLAAALDVELGEVFYMLDSEDPKQARKIIREKINTASDDDLRIISKVISLIF